MSSAPEPQPTVPNAQRLLWAGFTAILASGVGFSIRGGILGQWAQQFGFTQTELGAITGGGLTGFGIVILAGAMLADKVGYGSLMVAAFVMHLVSLGVLFSTGLAYDAGGKPAAFQCLFWGWFLFSIGNGIAESVVNPLVANLFPKKQTHYLNILHAGWPAGLVLGGLLSAICTGEGFAGWKPLEKPLEWKYQIAFILIPVVIYGIMLLGQRFPKSEASLQGVSYKGMLREVGMLGAAVVCGLFFLFFKNDIGLDWYFAAAIAGGLWLGFSYFTGFHLGPILLAVLLVTHALVGYVELGTDSWITRITGSIMNSTQNGLLLLVYTSSLMFILRFFAGPIVEKTSPLGLLFVSALLGVAGLLLLGSATSVWFCVLAATVYACGKTFFWPTMLAVGSEQFPRGGAITIGAMGGVGMLSAGLLGGPGIGFEQDYYATESLQSADHVVFDRYKSNDANTFLGLSTQGLNGTKVDVLLDKDKEGGAKIRADLARLREDESASKQALDDQRTLVNWWDSAEETAATDRPLVKAATLHGSRMALRLTAAVPAAMAVIYLGLIVYFQSKGGYKPKILISKEEEAALMVGGTKGPAEY